MRDEFMARYYTKLMHDEEGQLTKFALKDKAFEIFKDADKHISEMRSQLKQFYNDNPLYNTYNRDSKILPRDRPHGMPDPVTADQIDNFAQK